MKPVIGVSANLDGEGRNYFLKDYYITSILEAGGVPVIIPAVYEHDVIQSYVEVCSAFILSGGGDADPSYWGELPGKELGEVNPARDSFEITIARSIIKERKPVLGICRGCQVINIAVGGSIIQDIKGSMAHQQIAPRNYAFHWVYIEKHSKLASVLRSEQIKVNTFHHQAVKDLGQGMRIAACAADGTIEAIESKGGQFILGVQWHPECMEDIYAHYLFKTLIDEAVAERFII